MKKKIYLLLSLISFSLVTQAGGGWTQSKGNGFYKLSEWWIVYDQHFNEEGSIDPNPERGLFNTFLYAEYGVTDRFTAIFNGTVFSRNYQKEYTLPGTSETVKSKDLNSIGDIDLVAKYALTKPGSPIPIAASLLLGIPTGNDGVGNTSSLQTGDGEFNQMLQLDISKGLRIKDAVSLYGTGYGAFNNRTNGYSSEVRYGLEAGLGFLKDRIWVVAKLNTVNSLKNKELDPQETGSGLFANNASYASYTYELSAYVTKNMGISAAYASVFSAELIAASPTYSVGIFLDTSK